MATTSGTYTFSYNRDQIIRAALRKVGAIAGGEIPSAEMTLDASDALNAMVKEWEATGIHVWTQQQATIFLQPNQVQYQLGPGTPDFCAIGPNLGYYVGTTAVNALSSGNTALTVSSATGIANGYYIGIALNSGGLFFTTVASISGTNITLTTGASGPINAGAYVYCYQNQINVKPLRVPFGRRIYLSNSVLNPMLAMSRKDYFDLPNKFDTGTPTQFYYSPQLTMGYFNVWPAPYDSTSAVNITWYQPIQDFDAAGDLPDLPQEWISTIIFNLAVEIAPEYGVTPQVYAMIKQAADQKMDRLSGWDREPESTYFGVDFTPWGG